MSLPIIALGVGLGISAVGNVVLGVQNRKLRQQVDQLTHIQRGLESRITELEKKYKALKLFAFSEKKRVKNEIAKSKEQLSIVTREKQDLESKIS